MEKRETNEKKYYNRNLEPVLRQYITRGKYGDFAIILQLPAFFAVTFPLLVTVAIFLSELDHFIVFLLPVTLRVAASPSSNVNDVLFNFVFAEVCIVVVINNAPKFKDITAIIVEFYTLQPHINRNNIADIKIFVSWNTKRYRYDLSSTSYEWRKVKNYEIWCDDIEKEINNE